MKKVLIFAFLFLVLASLTISQGTFKSRLNNMNPAANATKLGDIMDVVTAVLRGDTVLTTSLTFSYGVGASDTTKLYITGATESGKWFILCNTDSIIRIIDFAKFTKAFTADDHDIPDGSFASFRVSGKYDSTVTLTISAATYLTADSAVAAVPAVPALNVNLGYVIIGGNGGIFNATTTKLNADTISVWYHPVQIMKDLSGS